MPWPTDCPVPRRYEAHFGDRVVRCFADRAADLGSLFADIVAKRGDQTALVLDDQRLRYTDLDRASAAVAGNLALRCGIGHGDRVAVFSGNCIEFPILTLACLRLGAVLVPLGHRLKAAELAFMIGHAGAKVLVVEAALADRAPDAEQVPTIGFRFAYGGSAPGFEAFDTLREPIEPPDVAIDEEDVAAILYTSGTTGRPKGATLTHFNIIHTLLHYRICMDLSADDRSLMAVPITHVTGLVAQFLTMVGVGGCTVMMREFKARAALDLLAGERITHSIMVPAMYNLMLRDPDFEEFDLSAMTVGGFGGAPMPEATIVELERRMPHLVLRNAYGATESTSPATLTPPGAIADHRDSVGIAVPCAEIRVVDEDGREVPAGETGEIWIGGPMVVPGYWNDPAASAAEFTGGYWHSGDIGRLDWDGYLHVLDRRKDMINRAGYKVFSAEVENVLSEHGAVAECAVVGRPDPVLGERVHAFVVADGELSVEAVRAFCAQRLADYKVPETYTVLGEGLPRNANGKVMKPELRARALAEFDDRQEARQ